MGTGVIVTVGAISIGPPNAQAFRTTMPLMVRLNAKAIKYAFN
jgi:hypothetical protein